MGATGRTTLVVDGRETSVVRGGSGPPLLLLHGTFWSRVWEPVAERLAVSHEILAPDYPGFGRSAGRLEADRADAASLADWALRLLDAAGVTGSFGVAGHDIGGAVAQQLAARHPERLTGMALVNSVLYDSWPVSAVARFRDPAVVERTTPQALVEVRAASLAKATARELTPQERDEYLFPWHDADRAASWMALAAAADARYTLDVVEPLRKHAIPTVLVWGEDDEFQPISYAERYAAEMPAARLERIPGARHIPMEDAPDAVAAALA